MRILKFGRSPLARRCACLYPNCENAATQSQHGPLYMTDIRLAALPPAGVANVYGSQVSEKSMIVGFAGLASVPRVNSVFEASS